MMRKTDIQHGVKKKDIWYSVTRLMWDTDLIYSRFTLALAEFIWALILLMPGNTFPTSEFPKLGFMSENIWGIIFLISGVIQTMIILYEHMHNKFARRFAMINAIMWIYLVFAILIDTYPPVAGIAAEFALMIIAVWIWVRPYILAEGLYRAGIR
jgi:uncharacterized membrane protein